MWAAAWGRPEALGLLSAAAGERDKSGLRAVQVAAMSGRWECVLALADSSPAQALALAAKAPGIPEAVARALSSRAEAIELSASCAREIQVALAQPSAPAGPRRL